MAINKYSLFKNIKEYTFVLLFITIGGYLMAKLISPAFKVTKKADVSCNCKCNVIDTLIRNR